MCGPVQLPSKRQMLVRRLAELKPRLLTGPEHIMFLPLLLASIPVVCIPVFLLGCSSESLGWWATGAAYAFSIGMIGLYIYPFINPMSGLGFKERLHAATMNWIVWLSVMTELVFQIPQQLFQDLLHKSPGSLGEFPFFAYGLSDCRWNWYNGGEGLDYTVMLINWNDGLLGAAVGAAFAYDLWQGRRGKVRPGPRIVLVILLIFRDATLFRETVEYFYFHHTSGYAHTVGGTSCTHPIQNPALRPHGIATLWTINVIWLIAPLLSMVWGYWQIKDVLQVNED